MMMVVVVVGSDDDVVEDPQQQRFAQALWLLRERDRESVKGEKGVEDEMRFSLLLRQ